MNRFNITKGLFVIALLFSTSQLYALRCGSCIVSRGDSKQELLSCCGNPSSGYQTETYSVDSGEPVKEWYVYNCKDGFVMQVIIEKGEIRSIENKGRAKGDKNCS